MTTLTKRVSVEQKEHLYAMCRKGELSKESLVKAIAKIDKSTISNSKKVSLVVLAFLFPFFFDGFTRH